MKFLALVLKSARRSKRRTALTVLSVARHALHLDKGTLVEGAYSGGEPEAANA